MIRTRTAVIRRAPSPWEVTEVQIEPPRQGELVVQLAATGLCHSDHHIASGMMTGRSFPFAGGHEGAGVVVEVGPNTPDWKVGDHVVFSFVATCGRCRWCASGRQNLCDAGARIMAGTRADGSHRMWWLDGDPVGQMCGLSTFSELTVVAVESAVKISKDVPLDKACLVGCAVGTGWGSAVNSAQIRPGDCVIVMGIGGVGINAVQGAVHAGAATVIAVDPVEFKLKTALTFGATDVYASIKEAAEFARSVTNGQGADAAIVTVGVTEGSHIAAAFDAIRKGGTCVVTGVGSTEDRNVPIPAFQLTAYNKRLQGALYGELNPTRDIPLLLRLYQSGRLLLDEQVTRTYTLDEINDGYDDMLAGTTIRGVILLN